MVWRTRVNQSFYILFLHGEFFCLVVCFFLVFFFKITQWEKTKKWDRFPRFVNSAPFTAWRAYTAEYPPSSSSKFRMNHRVRSHKRRQKLEWHTGQQTYMAPNPNFHWSIQIIPDLFLACDSIRWRQQQHHSGKRSSNLKQNKLLTANIIISSLLYPKLLLLLPYISVTAHKITIKHRPRD